MGKRRTRPKTSSRTSTARATVSGIRVSTLSAQDAAHNKGVAKGKQARPQPKKDAAVLLYLAEREAQSWLLSRQGFDAEAVAYRCRTERSCDWHAIVIAHVDWETGHDTWAHVEEAHRQTPGALARAERRQTRPGTSLRGTCEVCEDPSQWPKQRIAFCSDLCARRPGAVIPWEGCQGCVHSYVGELDDDDKSLVDAFSPTAEDLPAHLRHLWRRGGR